MTEHLKQQLFAAFLFASPLLAQKPACPPPVSRISIADGTFSSQPGVSFRLKHFDATLVPIGKTAPTCYEKITVVSRAEIFVSNESLSNIFSEKLQDSQSKIKNFRVQNGLLGVTLSGEIAHVVPLHFTVEGPVTTNGSEIRLDAKKIKADGIPIQELMHMVGAELGSVLQLKDMSGIVIEDNALSFSPEQVAHLKGHIAWRHDKRGRSDASIHLRATPSTCYGGSDLPTFPQHPVRHAAAEQPRSRAPYRWYAWNLPG